MATAPYTVRVTVTNGKCTLIASDIAKNFDGFVQNVTHFHGEKWIFIRGKLFKFKAKKSIYFLRSYIGTGWLL